MVGSPQGLGTVQRAASAADALRPRSASQRRRPPGAKPCRALGSRRCPHVRRLRGCWGCGCNHHCARPVPTVGWWWWGARKGLALHSERPWPRMPGGHPAADAGRTPGRGCPASAADAGRTPGRGCRADTRPAMPGGHPAAGSRPRMPGGHPAADTRPRCLAAATRFRDARPRLPGRVYPPASTRPRPCPPRPPRLPCRGSRAARHGTHASAHFVLFLTQRERLAPRTVGRTNKRAGPAAMTMKRSEPRCRR